MDVATASPSAACAGSETAAVDLFTRTEMCASAGVGVWPGAALIPDMTIVNVVVAGPPCQQSQPCSISDGGRADALGMVAIRKSDTAAGVTFRLPPRTSPSERPLSAALSAGPRRGRSRERRSPR